MAGYILRYVKPNKSGSIKTLRGLKEKSVKEVFLYTRRKNQTASSFYKNYYRNGDDALLMKKSLGG